MKTSEMPDLRAKTETCCCLKKRKKKGICAHSGACGRYSGGVFLNRNMAHCDPGTAPVLHLQSLRQEGWEIENQEETHD